MEGISVINKKSVFFPFRKISNEDLQIKQGKDAITKFCKSAQFPCRWALRVVLRLLGNSAIGYLRKA